MRGRGIGIYLVVRWEGREGKMGATGVDYVEDDEDQFQEGRSYTRR